MFNVAPHPLGAMRWTPYALAIAESYEIQIPFFMTVPTGLTGSTGQDVISVSSAYEYDLLIFGAMLNIGSSAVASDNGQQTFLNVTDVNSGVSWVVPDWPDVAPATAFGAVPGQVSALLPLPEAYFLPAFDQLRHEWKSFSVATNGGTITWAGVQLIKPRGGKAPDTVCVDGEQIRVGSRIPWFAAMGLGTQGSTSSQPSYTLINGAEYVQYTPAMGCDVEIHDLAANYFLQQGVSTSPDNVQIGISDRSQRRLWSLNKAPSPSVFGNYTQLYPALPFTQPYVLPAGHRLQINSINQTGADILEPYLVLRGVQRCGY